MKQKIIICLIVLVSFALSICIGMMDYETESLTHLLTSDLGNLVALGIFTTFFTSVGLGIYIIIQFVRTSNK